MVTHAKAWTIVISDFQKLREKYKCIKQNIS